MNKEAFKSFVEASGLSDKDKNLVKGVMYDYLGSVDESNDCPLNEPKCWAIDCNCKPVTQSADVMTLEECKDEIAQRHDFDSWAEMDKAMDHKDNLFHPLNNYDRWQELHGESAELYASKFKKRIDELEYKLTSSQVKSDQLQAELEQVKAERDSIREALQEIVELPDLRFGDDYKTDGYALALEDVHRIANKALQSTKQ